MKLKDLVANSLPRVRGRKSKKSSHSLHPVNHSSRQEPEFSTHAPYFMQQSQQHPAFESRESSVERSSTVAVVDAPWRDAGAAYNSKGDRTHNKSMAPRDMGLVTQSMTYYTPLTHPQQHGMVMSHSADGIAAQAMLLAAPHDYATGSKVTSLSEHYAMTGYQHPNMIATSENAVNFVGPNYVYHTQHQHQHHHHHHSHHDHHYVYHHHHHDRQQIHTQTQPQIPKPDPLTERNSQQMYNSACASNLKPAEKPRKPEGGGFLRKSFASFRAMRKAGSRNKEKDGRIKPHSDENDKCLVCPYPQPQGATEKSGAHKKPSKQSKKEMKSLMKSLKSKHNSTVNDKQSEASWCSDSDANKVYHHSHHIQGYDAVPYATINKFPVRECSMEGSISRHTATAGSRERMDQQYFETASLSGYDSDVTKNRTGRSRSRIKTNPWLPSPQPSLSMGRRFENYHQSNENNDVMDDESPGCFPRSASFDYHSQLGVTSFMSTNEQKRNIQRHRSLTPVDLKLNLSLPRSKKTETSISPADQQTHLNDLNTNSTRSRPNSIVSPNSEFVALADNIEQLANNISFEYEDCFEASEKRGPIQGRETSTPTRQCRRNSEESNMSKKRKSGSSPTLPENSLADSAHSPDSGIGCLGSCDGDDSMTLGNSIVLEQSPTVSIPSSQSTNSNSDSLNSTPKRKNSKTSGNLDGKHKKSSSFMSESSKRLQGSNEKDDAISKCNRSVKPPLSQSKHEVPRLIGSSSSESITSAVVSESDIDNTSYKFVDSSHLMCNESPIAIDPLKPRNVTPCLMVDERLDINFRSLPRKLNGKHQQHQQQQQSQLYAKKRAENDGRFTISRSKNVIAEREKRTNSSLLVMVSPSIENVKSSSSLSPVTKDTNWNGIQGEGRVGRGHKEIELKCDMNAGNGENEEIMAVNFVDLSSAPSAFKIMSEPETGTGDLVTMDTVDACVQTDFLLDIGDTTWDRKQPTGLSPLDDSFDPVESTRRWLISGNMQGSADTGYSSQPRDSHVFLEEEAALLQLETLSNVSGGASGGFSSGQCKMIKAGSNCSSSYKGKASSLDFESPCSCGSCSNSSGMSVNQQSRGHFPVGLVDNDGIRNEAIFSESALSNLLHSLKPPFETDFDLVDDTKNNVSNATAEVNKRHSGEKPNSVIDVTKRHSSDSSTSTLTSDVIVGHDDENINFENINNSSFVYCPPRPESDPQYNGAGEMEDDEYHDYVNLPVRYFGAKSHPTHKLELQSGHRCSSNGKRRCQENTVESSELSRTVKQSHQHSFESSHKTHATFDETKNSNGKVTGNKSDYFRPGEDIPNLFHCVDRPDYLEFLRDAPLQHSPSSQIFIVPGFGPLEFPTGMIYPLPSKGEHFRNLQHSQKALSNNKIKEGKKSVSPECDKISGSSKTNSKSSKAKKEERPTNLNLLSYNCPPGINHNVQSMPLTEGTIKHTNGGENVPPLSSSSSSSIHGKRKTQKDTTGKSNRCPTVRSYDVDDFAPINRVDLTSAPPSSSTVSSSTSRQEKLSGSASNSNSTRNIAERVAVLRREKEIIYRKIQEVQQQQETDRQREFQQQRNIHSQRKDELLETLRILKDKLEEQSKTLQTKCRDEM